MKLLFEISVPGHGTQYLPSSDVPKATLPENMRRKQAMKLPEISEVDLTRHYTKLSRRAFGVNSGFYPLGSCTMKYNPRLNERVASLPGFTGVHPLQPKNTVKGCLEVLDTIRTTLCHVTGMDDMTFQPAAGAHGEYTGLLLIKAYLEKHGQKKRTKMIVPDSAHGTNPASAVMVGFDVVNIPSDEKGCVDMAALKKALNDETAGLMLTNPNTVGLFDPNILDITRLVHEAGGLCYYDGANLNAIMGPGAGPVGCKAFLKEFLPYSSRGEKGTKNSIGQVRSFYGNYGVVVKALTYILVLGAEGMREASETAVLNANYLMHKVAPYFPVAFKHGCMHEFILTLEETKKQTGVSALDVAKGLLDEGMHPPTMYFPLIVHEALMLEPTETESRETLDAAAAALGRISKMVEEEPEKLHLCPCTTPIGRPDEVAAARTPILRYCDGQ